ncbi:MAG: DUF2634 domain-containing protein [Eubacterium sp.]|nr:DUF2634 domain-containing protein [Eubacterium sp.]
MAVTEMETDLVLDIDEIEEEVKQETRTYNIDFLNGRIDGMIDGSDALEQAIRKILMTERYKNLIYSEDYGCEIKDTMMSNENTDSFLEAEIPVLIQEALLEDERILDVSNFEFYIIPNSIDSLIVTFDVSTIYGVISMEEAIV